MFLGSFRALFGYFGLFSVSWDTSIVPLVGTACWGVGGGWLGWVRHSGGWVWGL